MFPPTAILKAGTVSYLCLYFPVLPSLCLTWIESCVSTAFLALCWELCPTRPSKFPKSPRTLLWEVPHHIERNKPVTMHLLPCSVWFFVLLKKTGRGHLLLKLLLITTLRFIFMLSQSMDVWSDFQGFEGPGLFQRPVRSCYVPCTTPQIPNVIKQPRTLLDTMVNTPDVVLVLREPRVQGMWDVGKQVVIENYEKDHPGGKAGAEARLEGKRENGVGRKASGKTSLEEVMS